MNDAEIKEWLYKRYTWEVLLNIATRQRDKNMNFSKGFCINKKSLEQLIFAEIDYKKYGNLLYCYLTSQFLCEWVDYMHKVKKVLIQQAQDAFGFDDEYNNCIYENICGLLGESVSDV